MVTDQHKKIKGYRDLSLEEIEMMNEIKEHGEKLNELIEKLTVKSNEGLETSPTHRWICIGGTHLQQGIMALVRSVAKPESF